jgi:RNA polymerase sigma-70 factor (ECF subfamily)
MGDSQSVEIASRQLLVRLQEGESVAAGEILDRYTTRLIGLARKRLSPKLARRIDPEDVVQSAYRSFFRAADRASLHVNENGDLWRLLAAITLNKLRMQARRHRAARRNLDREEFPDRDDGKLMIADQLTESPSPEQAALIAEQVELLMRGLVERQRYGLELRLQGFLIEEIAQKLECSERTVRRWLDQIKAQLVRELQSSLEGP